jgi:hypothetical protein
VGERAGQASQIAPDAQLDNFVGQQVAAGLATASIVVLGHLINAALECAPAPALHLLLSPGLFALLCKHNVPSDTQQKGDP